MKRAGQHRAASQRALLLFLATMVIAVFCIGLAVHWLQERHLRNEAQGRLNTELILLGELALDPLLSSDYSAVERLIQAWVKRQNFPLQIIAVAPNGFEIARSENGKLSTASLQSDQQVLFQGRMLMRLRAQADLPRYTSGLAAIVRNAVLLSIGATLLLGWGLWIILQRTAIRPLEAEIEAREARDRELQRRTVELETAMHELEAFAYSLSHDLRTPLRAIDGFSKLVLEDYGDKLDETGRGYLERVRSSVQRLGTLIDELLEFSRVGRGALKRQTVDLSGLASEVIEQLRSGEPERQVDVTIAPGVAGLGDPTLVRLVLQNLLGNAWKYTSHTTAARIEFGAALLQDETIYHVRDNGSGFDMSHAGKLFQPFQRLHRPEEFDGTGIGLATVKRIIQRHGGRVWAEAIPGQGATFFFSLGPRLPGNLQ